MKTIDELKLELEQAETIALQIRREIAAGPCRSHGHDWQFHGGANAGCGPDCSCSVPVMICSKCGGYDYGDNDEAAKIKSECAEGRA